MGLMAAVPVAARRAARESLTHRSQRAAEMIRVLKRAYPEADCALTYKSAWQLLVATILSAQCTDTRVNKVTPALFRQYRNIRAFAKAPPGELELAVRSTGFFRNKARAIKGAAQQILRQHAGRVPREMQELTALPGVGRKTAHVVRGTWFGLPAITVDTHVGRLSRRLGLTQQTDPVRVERDLEQLLPPATRTFTSHALIWHGRQVCHSRRPECATCSMTSFCPSAGSFAH